MQHQDRACCNPMMFIDCKAREIICLVASPSVCVSAFYIMCMTRSGRYMGSACRVLRKNTMTHKIQSKTSVCLSVIQERSRSKSCAQQSGAFNAINRQHVAIPGCCNQQTACCDMLQSMYDMLQSRQGMLQSIHDMLQST